MERYRMTGFPDWIVPTWASASITTHSPAGGLTFGLSSILGDGPTLGRVHFGF